MKSVFLRLVAFWAVFGLAMFPALFAQDGASEMEKNFAAFMTPGKAHGEMAKAVGKWKVTYKVWMEPGGEPMITEGSCENKMIMDGRYLYSENDGVFMGMPMKGLLLQGFDNHRKIYNAVWIDNMGTGFAIAEGKYNEAGELVMDGKLTDPMTKQVSAYRTMNKVISENKHMMEMYMIMPDGQAFKTMEVLYTR